MNRLTRWNGSKWVLPQGQWREITERLAAYENTGLEPEKIETRLTGEDNDPPIPPLGDIFTAVIVLHGRGGNIPYIDPVNGCAFLHASDVMANADNAEVIQQKGANHLVIEIYPDHWHVAQVSGYTPDTGLYTKFY